MTGPPQTLPQEREASGVRGRESLQEQVEGATSDVFLFDGARCDRLVNGVLAALSKRDQL